MNHFLGSIEYDLILVFIGILFFRMVFLKLYMSEKERIIVENAPSSFFLTSAGLIIGIGCIVLSDRIGIDDWIKNLVYLYLGCVVLWWNTIIIYTKLLHQNLPFPDQIGIFSFLKFFLPLLFSAHYN